MVPRGHIWDWETSMWALKIHPVRYSPDPEQLAAHIDKRNKGLGTEIILYCLHVRKTGPEKLNCLAQHCIRIIWQEWEANGEHQSPLHGSACPFSNTNSFFLSRRLLRHKRDLDSCFFTFHYYSFQAQQELLVSEIFDEPVSCPPHQSKTHLCSLLKLCFFSKISSPQMHKSMICHISADCFHLGQELLHILP